MIQGLPRALPEFADMQGWDRHCPACCSRCAGAHTLQHVLSELWLAVTVVLARKHTQGRAELQPVSVRARAAFPTTI